MPPSAHDRRSSPFQRALLLAFFALVFYRLGASNVEGLLNYPFWLDMGPMMSNADFIQLRVDHLWKIYPLLVIPVGLVFLVTATLAVLAPPGLGRWPFVAAAALQLVGIVSTIAIQVPIQNSLSQSGFDAAELTRLIQTDLLFRKLPSVAEALIVLGLLWRVIVR